MLNLAAGQFNFVTRRAPDIKDQYIKKLTMELKQLKSRLVMKREKEWARKSKKRI